MRHNIWYIVNCNLQKWLQNLPHEVAITSWQNNIKQQDPFPWYLGEMIYCRWRDKQSSVYKLQYGVPHAFYNQVIGLDPP